MISLRKKKELQFYHYIYSTSSLQLNTGNILICTDDLKNIKLFSIDNNYVKEIQTITSDETFAYELSNGQLILICDI